MSRRRGIVAVITGSCLALGGVTSEAVAPAVGASGATTATAAMILVRFATLWFAVLVGFLALSILKRRHPGLLADAATTATAPA